MLGFGRFRVLVSASCMVIVGCTTSSIGLDLSLRGVLTLVLTRDSGTSSVRADAFVKDNGSVANVELADNQNLSVNGRMPTRSRFQPLTDRFPFRVPGGTVVVLKLKSPKSK